MNLKVVIYPKVVFVFDHGDSKGLVNKINFFFKIRNNKTKFNYYSSNSKDYYNNN